MRADYPVFRELLSRATAGEPPWRGAQPGATLPGDDPCIAAAAAHPGGFLIKVVLSVTRPGFSMYSNVYVALTMKPIGDFC